MAGTAADGETEGPSDGRIKGGGASLFGFLGSDGSIGCVVSAEVEAAEVSIAEEFALSVLVPSCWESGASPWEVREAREAEGEDKGTRRPGDKEAFCWSEASAAGACAGVLGTEYSVLSDGRPSVVAWAGSGDPRPTVVVSA